MPAVLQSVTSSSSQSSTDEGDLSIILALNSPKGYLRIEKISKGCFKLFYSDTAEKTDFRHIDDIRRCGLEKSIPLIPLFRAVIVSRKIGALRLRDYKETTRLSKWLKINRIK